MSHSDRDSFEDIGRDAPARSGRAPAESLVDREVSDRVSPRRLVAPAVLFALGFVYILAGMANRQLVEGANYDEKFRLQSSRVIQVPAPRGHIYDRNGKLVVGNRARHNIVIDLGGVTVREQIRRLYLADLRKQRDAGKKIDAETRAGLRREARLKVLQSYLDRVNRVLGRDPSRVDAAAVLNHIERKNALDFPLLTDIEPEGVARFVENFGVNEPLRLYVDSVRTYPYGDTAAHVLGYLGNTDDLGDDPAADEQLLSYITGEAPEPAATPEEEERRQELLRKLRLRYPGKIGKTGLEVACNELLQGTPGSQVWRVNPNGYLDKRISETKATQGAHVRCSLDIELQVVAEKALAATPVGKAGTHLKGALVALDVGSGEVLAMSSYPRFDPNKFADRVSAEYYAELKASGGELNRATQGLYPPGSTFKIITAIAAMRAGKLTPDEVLECGQFLAIGGRDFPEHDGMAFGSVDLSRMLAISCNVYCYQIGLRMGPAILAAEAKRFGLDSKSPIEILSSPASLMIVPDREYKRARKMIWTDGDTANTSIGQGLLRTTPLNMACMIASVAGKRTRTHPSLLADMGHAHAGEPIGMTEGQYAGLLAGLRACVQQGTGKRVQVPGLDIAGKTGTAEFKKDGRDTNLAWFVGFAPADAPQIALAVVLEGEEGVSLHGGASAGPVARAVFEKWLALQKKSAGSP